MCAGINSTKLGGFYFESFLKNFLENNFYCNLQKSVIDSKIFKFGSVITALEALIWDIKVRL